MSEECGSCRYFRRISVGHPQGVCRARPPTPMMITIAKNPVTGDPFPVINTYWPEVPDVEWCGDYTRKPMGAAIDLEKMDRAEAEGSA